MPVDYDLVILGGVIEGRIAAKIAVGYGARTALVEPPGLFADGQKQRFLLKGLQQLGQIKQRQAVGEWFGYDPPSGSLDWSALTKWSLLAAESQYPELSVAAMSAVGIDVVLEEPERLSRRMVLSTASRRLTTRGVLAAYGLVPVALPLLASAEMPNAMDVVGSSETALAWAEALATVGVQVRLVTNEILPEADEDLRRLVRSQLTATGIQITPIFEKSEFTLKVDPVEPALTLPSFVQTTPSLKANCRLQTKHSRLFACGSTLGGSDNARLAEYEARIAVSNALFLPNRRVDYGSVVQGYGRYAHAGLTQAEAAARYGDDVQVWTASDANSANLSRVSPLPEYCKLICVGDRLVGVHLLGEGAEGLACLLSKRLGQAVLAEGSWGGLGLVDLVFKSEEKPRHTRWQPGKWQRDWAENWFNWRRSQRS